MRKHLLAMLFVAVARSGLGEDITAGRSPASPPPHSSALAAPVCPTSTYGSAPDNGSPNWSLSKADHLRIAAEHLEAAGLKDESQRVRKKEAEERARLVKAPFQPIVVNL